MRLRLPRKTWIPRETKPDSQLYDILLDPTAGCTIPHCTLHYCIPLDDSSTSTRIRTSVRFPISRDIAHSWAETFLGRDIPGQGPPMFLLAIFTLTLNSTLRPSEFRPKCVLDQSGILGAIVVDVYNTLHITTRPPSGSSL